MLSHMNMGIITGRHKDVGNVVSRPICIELLFLLLHVLWAYKLGPSHFAKATEILFVIKIESRQH